MVVGFLAQPQKRVRNLIGIREDIFRCNPKHFYPLMTEPCRAVFITSRTISEIVGCSVNFDRELTGGAIEIEHVLADRMLSAEPDFRSA